MSGWRKSSPQSAVRPEINVTPLVDVVLVLLIIFMVVAPQMEQEVQVELPGIYNPDPDVEGQMDPMKVTVTGDKEYFLEQESYPLDELIDVLAAEHAIQPYRRLVIRADASLTYGDVREILNRTREVGFPGSSLLVGERHKESVAEAAHTQESVSVASTRASPPADAAGEA